MAAHRLRRALFEGGRRAGHLQHASIIAHDLFLVNRDPFHAHSHLSTVLVANMRGFDLDCPAVPRHPDGFDHGAALGRMGVSWMRGQR
eukprot:4991701-Pyramimonas_sp.AAC.2